MSASCHCHDEIDLHPRLMRDVENCESPECRDHLHHAEAHASHHGADAKVHAHNDKCCCEAGKCCCATGACGKDTAAKKDGCC
ncbi:hypothetical protein H9P43_000749 [Blastocladiella emersonii ATCC 22665]|nr:hypothetical protein H9P43_000749 [Blastocladiella emersonii ATCC 22665]